jgi:hypothetical protein
MVVFGYFSYFFIPLCEKQYGNGAHLQKYVFMQVVLTTAIGIMNCLIFHPRQRHTISITIISQSYSTGQL